MPRSGTSLVEQILASHPAIVGGGELPLLGRLMDGLHTAAWARGAPFPACLDGLSLRDADAMTNEYLAGLQALPGLKEAEAARKRTHPARTRPRRSHRERKFPGPRTD